MGCNGRKHGWFREHKRHRDAYYKGRVEQKKRGVMIKAFHPIAYEKGVYVVDFWKKGTVKVDRNLKRFKIKASSKSDAIKKAKNLIGGKRQQLFMYADVPEKLEKPLVTKEEYRQCINAYLKSKGQRPLMDSELSRFF